MVYQVNNLALVPVREMYSGPNNDVMICEDLREEQKTYYTVLLIKNHSLAKKILQIFNDDKNQDKKCYIDIFSHNEGFGIVFPYIKERYLTDFYMDNYFSLEVCEQICINLIMECLSTKLPYPFLYLILQERQIFLRADSNVQLGYPLDLTNLDERIDEKECVVVCATIIRDLLGPFGNEKAISYELVSKKIKKKVYTNFKSLYFDVKMTSTENLKDDRKKLDKLKGAVKEKSSVFFRILLFVCIILMILAIISIISMILGGRIPFLNLFSSGFKVIGTENLIR